ncbi:MAG: sugar ABC transporter permease [Acetobacteraceae bacterium]
MRTLNLLMFLPSIVTPVVAALFLRWIFIGRWGLLSATLIGLGIFPARLPGRSRLGARDRRVRRCLAVHAIHDPGAVRRPQHGGPEPDRGRNRSTAPASGRCCWRIMLPAIRPLIVFVLAIRLMDAFRFFDTIYVLTSGGPGTATETITLYTYAIAFRLLQVGKASALGVLTLLFVAALIAIMIRLVYRRERGAF